MPKSQLILIVALLGLCACNQGSCYSEQEQDQEADPYPYVEEQDTFTKVERDHDFDLSKALDGYNTNSVSSGRIALKRGRPHMAPNKKHNQFALYEGESFVLDLAYYPINFTIHKNFTIRILADFKPVDFALIKTAKEDDYPNLESLNTPDLNLDKRHDFDLISDAANKLTVVVPPSSFTELKAYDIRVLITPDIGPKDNISRIVDPNLSFSMTLYYGGASFNQVELTTPEKTALIRNQKQLGLLNSFGFSNSVLIPNLEYLNDQSQPLAGSFNVAQTTTVSAVYYADPSAEGRAKDDTAVIYNTFIVNKNVEDGKFVQVKKLPFTAIPKSGLQAPVEELALERSEVNEKTVYFVTFDRPYKDQALADDEFHPLIRVSNPLFLKHAPQD